MARFRSATAARAAVAALVLVGVLTSCGSSGTKTTPTSATAGTAGPATTGGGQALSGTITVTANAAIGGKNDAEAEWITKSVIPDFQQQQKAQGQTVTIKFQGTGVADEDYSTRLALDLKSGAGPDVFDLDGPYYGEFSQAGYIQPLNKIVGAQADSWSGWAQIPAAVQTITQFNWARYGIPASTDGRVLFYNKQLFQTAGLPQDWQPKSWADVISAARQLKAKVPGIEAVQIDAGAPMGEATTLQGFLPFLAGAGQLIYDQATGKWQGNTPAMQATANFYHTIYAEGLGNAQLQLGANGRDQTFQLFSQGKVGIYAESNYLYDGVLAPDKTGLYPMATRNQAVGFAMIPAQTPGAGIRKQDFVSMSGGGGQAINPHTKNANLAWAFLSFMNSQPELAKYEALKPFISSRQDVNATALANAPADSFIAKNVLPLTAYRPSLAVYTQVSKAIQQLAQAVATGTSPASALQTYQESLKTAVGASNVASS